MERSTTRRNHNGFHHAPKQQQQRLVMTMKLVLFLCQAAAFALVPLAQLRTPPAITTTTSSRLHVGAPTDQAPIHRPLIPADDDESSDNQFLTPLVTTTTTTTTLTGFYDLEDANDDDDDISSSHDQDDAVQFTREKSDILEELEDRFYVDASGLQRKVERCILVGVDDVSAKRRRRRKDQKAAQTDPFSYLPQSRHGAGTVDNSVPVDDDDDMEFTFDESMTEMRELIKTAGLVLCGEITQRLDEVNPKTYIGSGKLQDANELLEQRNACTIVFDAELTPGQLKSLENALNKKVLQNDFMVQEGEIKVIDRTALILDIFAQHAKTREGKLQVDLALHEYRKPRLTRMWTHLERQSGAGGVGLRGPGESQLEIDKRLVRDRIITLKQKIDMVQKQRTMHRRGRERMGLPILALVGYTNSGKSSVLNYLTRAGVLAESMLFATLDPTTRRVKLPGYQTHPEVLLTDTVGFIQKLPTHLVAAFRATLEEVQEADVLVHIIDVSNPAWEKQERAVRSVLADLQVGDKPMVRVLNKIDLLNPEDAEYIKYEAATTRNTVAVSALYGDGMQDFVAAAEEAMAQLLVPIEIEIPYSKGDELNSIHEQGNVQVVDYRATVTYVRALVPRSIAMRLEPYSVVGGAHHKVVETAQKIKQKDQENDGIDWVALGRGRHSATSEQQ